MEVTLWTSMKKVDACVHGRDQYYFIPPNKNQQSMDVFAWKEISWSCKIKRRSRGDARQGDVGYFYFYRASRSTRLIRREDSMRGVVCPCRK